LRARLLRARLLQARLLQAWPAGALDARGGANFW
jgi:hypothetical protein